MLSAYKWYLSVTHGWLWNFITITMNPNKDKTSWLNTFQTIVTSRDIILHVDPIDSQSRMSWWVRMLRCSVAQLRSESGSPLTREADHVDLRAPIARNSSGSSFRPAPTRLVCARPCWLIDWSASCPHPELVSPHTFAAFADRSRQRRQTHSSTISTCWCFAIPTEIKWISFGHHQLILSFGNF